MIKTCKKCNVEKSLDEYHNKKMGKFGKDSYCILCAAQRSIEGRTKNYEKRRAKEKEYKENNREKIRESGKIYDQANKEKIAARKRLFRQENRERLSVQKKEYRSKPEVKARDGEYKRNKYKTNIQYKLSCRIRVRIGNFLKAKNNTKKVGSGVKDLGCSLLEFRLYIESKWESWMNWNNYGVWDSSKRTWQLDHIIPLCKFNLSNRDEFLKAAHYTNMQPLCTQANYTKNRF